MEPFADDLLVQFADELQVGNHVPIALPLLRFSLCKQQPRQAGCYVQGWDAETAAGLAAVTTLQRCFGELESSQPSKETEDVYKRLMELVSACSLRRLPAQHIATAESQSLGQDHVYMVPPQDPTLCCCSCARCSFSAHVLCRQAANCDN